MANPTLLDMPIAVNGTKNTIPATTADPGFATQNAGFPTETSLPLNQGGIAPAREDFNGLFNLVSGVAFYAQKGFTFEYSSTQDYYKGCVIVDPSDGQKYECIANMTAGKVAPHSDSSHTYWQLAGSSSGASVAYNTPYRGIELPYTWAQIKAKVQDGDFSDLYIGDYKTITLSTNETVICEIAGINTYRNWGGGYPPINNHIDFISRNCIEDTYRFNATDTNNGNFDNPNLSEVYKTPWIASKLNNSINDYSQGLIGKLPSDLENVIYNKVCYLEQRWSSGGDVLQDTGSIWTAYVPLWIPTEVEVLGHPAFSEIGFGTAGSQQYPIFRLNPNRFIKRQGVSSTILAWWTLSAASGNSTDFCGVTPNGNVSTYSATSELGIPLCFRIA